MADGKFEDEDENEDDDECRQRWLAEMRRDSYIAGVNCLTKQERKVLWIVAILLATGWGTKMYRTAHLPASKPGSGAMPATVVIQQAKP